MQEIQQKKSPSQARVLLVISFVFCATLVTFQFGKLASFRALSRYDISGTEQPQKHQQDGAMDDFQLAYDESYGFFDDITSRDWELKKSKFRDIYPNTHTKELPSMLRNKRIDANAFFQNYFEPDFTCPHERRLGNNGDGGKWVCDPHRLQKKTKQGDDGCLIYSIGSNGDPSWENATRDFIGSHCEIHVFDMDNYTEIVESTGAMFHQWGISDNTTTRKAPGRKIYKYKTLQDTIDELGHAGRTIDIFKIDCEGM
jgi:hypothetical protein